jgi:hypothetical protein
MDRIDPRGFLRTLAKAKFVVQRISIAMTAPAALGLARGASRGIPGFVRRRVPRTEETLDCDDCTVGENCSPGLMSMAASLSVADRVSRMEIEIVYIVPYTLSHHEPCATIEAFIQPQYQPWPV